MPVDLKKKVTCYGFALSPICSSDTDYSFLLFKVRKASSARVALSPQLISLNKVYLLSLSVRLFIH